MINVGGRAIAFRVALVAGGSTLVFALGLGAAPAVASAPPAGQAAPEVSAAPAPCGFFTGVGGLEAYYNHCDTPPRTDVVINVNTIFAPDYELCVPPGVTYLGRAAGIRNAVYVGRTC